MSSPNIDRLSKFVHWHVLWKMCNTWLLNIRRHHNCVATLPCEFALLKITIIKINAYLKNYLLKHFFTNLLI